METPLKKNSSPEDQKRHSFLSLWQRHVDYGEDIGGTGRRLLLGALVRGICASARRDESNTGALHTKSNPGLHFFRQVGITPPHVHDVGLSKRTLHMIPCLLVFLNAPRRVFFASVSPRAPRSSARALAGGGAGGILSVIRAVLRVEFQVYK